MNCVFLLFFFKLYFCNLLCNFSDTFLLMVRMLQPVTCLLFLLKVGLMFMVSLVVFTIHWNIEEEKCEQINARKFKQKTIRKRTGKCNSGKNLRAHQKECKVETGIKRKADADDVKPLKLARLTQQSTQNCFLRSRYFFLF